MAPETLEKIEAMLAELQAGTITRVMIQVSRRDESGAPAAFHAVVDRGMHKPQALGIRRSPGAAIRAAMTTQEEEDLI